MLGEGEGDVWVGQGEGTLVGVLFVKSIANKGDTAGGIGQLKGSSRVGGPRNVHDEDPVDDIRQHQ